MTSFTPSFFTRSKCVAEPEMVCLTRSIVQSKSTCSDATYCQFACVDGSYGSARSDDMLSFFLAVQCRGEGESKRSSGQNTRESED